MRQVPLKVLMLMMTNSFQVQLNMFLEKNVICLLYFASKTEFIMFRSPHLRCDLSGLSVNVGESHVTQSLKVRDLGVDRFLNFDDHITAICRITYFHIRNIGKIWNLLSFYYYSCTY